MAAYLCLSSIETFLFAVLWIGTTQLAHNRNGHFSHLFVCRRLVSNRAAANWQFSEKFRSGPKKQKERAIERREKLTCDGLERLNHVRDWLHSSILLFSLTRTEAQTKWIGHKMNAILINRIDQSAVRLKLECYTHTLGASAVHIHWTMPNDKRRVDRA